VCQTNKLPYLAQVTTDKYRLAMKLGVQPRDLRLLDPQMARVSPPAILDRERAIVVNIGNIKWCVCGPVVFSIDHIR
jgi:hypothetical protein